MIRFEHVTRRYEPAGRPALDDVTVEFTRGEFTFLIGASGSGKSTLLRMILREGLPQNGRITVAGQNLGLMLERRVPEYRRSVGMVFQDFRLLPDKTVYDNVAFAMRVIGARRSQIRKRVTKVLERVNLEHLAKRYPHEISGGEQQRAAIARAIVNEPAILLADEPTGNLDPRASAEVIKILRWINASGTTVIMSTHERAIVDRMQRRVVQLHRGRLARDDAKGSYDPPRGSEAWRMLLEEEHESGVWSPDDPRARGAEATMTESSGPDHAGDSAEEGPSEQVSTQKGAQDGAGKPVRRRRSARAAKREQKRRATSAVRQEQADDAASAASPSGRHARQSASESGREDPDPVDAGIRVVWPADGRHVAAESLPEPAGDFSGAELPDLDRDGYAEPELEAGPAAVPIEESSVTPMDDAPTEDAVVRAAEDAVQPTAAEPAGAPHPRMSWLAHAEEQPVDRAGEVPTTSEPDPGAEDERLAGQDTEDEPPVTPAVPEPAGRGPQATEPASADAAPGEEAEPPESHLLEDLEAHADEEGQEVPAPRLRNSLPEVSPRPVPRPKSSSSQAGYTDTQRTAEQLGVGPKRSFLRRLRRDG